MQSHRSLRGVCVLSFALLLGQRDDAVPLPATRPASAITANDLAQAITQLTDDNPSVRDAATATLAAGAVPARALVLQAMRKAGATPEVKARCAAILLQLPWERADDSPDAQRILKKYSQPTESMRITLIAHLAEAHAAGGREALARLLLEEPSTTVRWAIVAQIRQLHDEELLHNLRQVEPLADAPQLAAAGYAWLARDAKRAMGYFHRAVEIEWANPSDDHPGPGERSNVRIAVEEVDDRGEIDRVFDLLYARAMSSGEVNEAADLVRQLAWRHLDPIDDVSGLPQPLLNLFALHALYGPLNGFEHDTKAFASYLGTPEILYSIGRMHQRLGQTLEADAAYRAASLASLGRQVSHQRVGAYLMRRGWYDLSERELLAALACSGPKKMIFDAMACAELSQVEGNLGDDRQAADRLRQSLELMRASGQRFAKEADFQAEIQWHELRAAMEEKNTAEIDLKLNTLVSTTVQSGELPLDVVWALKLRGRPEEAAKVFQPLYDTARRELDADPHNASLLNNLAWVCARCGEHKTEAEQWAKEAIEAAPGNPAFLDTAGEACFVAGHPLDAVHYETEALKLQPGDRFMTKQLKKFQKTADAQTTPPAER